MKTQPYDLIGDIHGQHDKLTALLDRLGYRKQDNRPPRMQPTAKEKPLPMRSRVG